MQRRIAFLLWALVFLFVLIYVPSTIVEPLITKVSSNPWVFALARPLVAIPFAPLLSWILFAQDHLAYGQSSASRFFRHYYVTEYAWQRMRGPRSRPLTLWFDYFNLWEDEAHPLHGYFRMNFERSYAVRMIFYFKRILIAFIAIACCSIVLLTWIWPEDPGWLSIRVVVLVSAILVLAWLQLGNRATQRSTGWDTEQEYEDTWHATGAFAKYKEIAGILRVKFIEYLDQKKLWDIGAHSKTSEASTSLTHTDPTSSVESPEN